jgi:hypothetical protein
MAEFTGTNFNALAWDAPKLENGDYGYLPNHEKYLLITAWLNTKLETIWTVDEENAVTKRLRGVYDTGRYDVKVRYDKKTEAVDWHFVKDYVFEVNYEHDIHWR